MEALAAIGLASNVVQFLEFVGKVISGGIEAHNATDGANATVRTLATVTADLNGLCEKLTQPHREQQTPTASDVALDTLVQSCKQLGQDLIKTLEGLKVNDHHKTWSSVCQALKSAWKTREIERYEARLEAYRSQIVMHLLTTLTQQNIGGSTPTDDRVWRSKVLETLQSLVNSHQELEIDVEQHLMQLKSTILSSLTSFSSSNAYDESKNIPSGVSSGFSKLAYQGVAMVKQARILRTLRFARFSEREMNIKDAYSKTYEWLFNQYKSEGISKNLCFLKWLQSGLGTFWVSGKAGSGKSTLMKFLHDHYKTRAALKSWAIGKQLCVAQFYFWNAGNAMQKGQLGLLQTMLFHILRQAPNLMPDLCSNRWTGETDLDESWTIVEATNALKKLKDQPVMSAKFCFFIDGLDECLGDHTEIIDVVKELIACDHIKICWSSRPWVVFERHFGENGGQKLHLHELIEGDIRHFATGSLQKDSHLSAQELNFQALVQDIVDNASGVFLWVFLAVRSLKRGMTNFDTPTELRERLRDLPKDLEPFFQRSLNSTDSIYRKHAARLYLIQLAAQHRELEAEDVAWFDQEDPTFGLDDRLANAHDLSQELRFRSWARTRVLARCQDLLEFDSRGRLQFLHRTVKDFLETADISRQLQLDAGQDFSPQLFLYNSPLLRIRIEVQAVKVGARKQGSFASYNPYVVKHAVANMFDKVILMQLDIQQALSLLISLEQTIWQLKSVVDCRITENDGLLHYPGWLADQLASHGVAHLMASFPRDKMPVFFSQTSTEFYPPLYVAMMFMRDRGRSTVRQLLECGANPNESLDQNETIWEDYVQKVYNRQLWWFGDHRQHDHIGMIMEELISHGADIDALCKHKDFFHVLCKEYPYLQEPLLALQQRILNGEYQRDGRNSQYQLTILGTVT